MPMQRTWHADIFTWDNDPGMEYSSADYVLHQDACENVYGGIGAGEVDLILTDPPYGTTRNFWDSKDFQSCLDETWAAWERIIKQDGVIAVSAAPPFDKVVAVSNLSMFRYEWIWNKNKATGHLNANRMPMKAHENILIFYGKQPYYDPQKTLGHDPQNAVNPALVEEPAVLRNYGHHHTLGNSGGQTERMPRTVINIPVHNNDCSGKWHPTQKPVKLMELMIRTYTKPGDVVFDPFMGSGATGKAALRCGRKFIGVELNAEYFNRTQQEIERNERKLAKVA